MKLHEWNTRHPAISTSCLPTNRIAGVAGRKSVRFSSGVATL
jgi:hypothetical protein